MKCCVNCKHFRDAQMHRTYKTPRCTQRGDDDCAYMRQHVCTLDALLYEPKTNEISTLTNPEGSQHAKQFKN